MGEQVREIKFRAWDNVENKMIYLGEDNDYVFEIASYGIRSVKIGENPFDYEVLEHLKYLQFTGLKDKNGKEIYEGDILYCHGATGVPLLQSYALPAKNPRGEKFIVVKLDCGFVLRHISTFGKSGYEIPNCIINGWTLMHNYDFWNHQRSFDVIGNIYDNPELLEGEHE